MKKYLAIPFLVLLLAGCGMTERAVENNANENRNMYDKDVNNPNFHQRGTTDYKNVDGGVVPNDGNVNYPDGYNNGGNLRNPNGTTQDHYRNNGLEGTGTGTENYNGPPTIKERGGTDGTGSGVPGGVSGGGG
jgi:hypothetical protein